MTAFAMLLVAIGCGILIGSSILNLIRIPAPWADRLGIAFMGAGIIIMLRVIADG